MSANLVNSTRIEVLTKDNYDTWRMQVEALLIKNDTWAYVCGEKQKPAVIAGNAASKTALDTWLSADKKARADLILSISPSELKQVRGCETSNSVWNKLESIYASKGPAKKATLLKQLTLQKMKEGDDIREHIMRFFDVVDKLAAMTVIIHKDLLTIMLLYSLPPSYENFRCAIESRDELPDAEALKVKILEESEVRTKPHSESSTRAYFTKGHNTKPFKSKYANKSTREFSTQRKFKIKCHRCGKLGHKAVQCYVDLERVKQEASQGESFLITEAAVPTALQSTNGEVNDKWCIDSGCTSHLCNNKQKFVSMTAPNYNEVKLANNASAKVRASGTAKLLATHGNINKVINLENALYVPEVKTNLLSVAKITDRNHDVTFTKNNAIVTNRNGDIKMVADRQGDLYYIREGVERANVAMSGDAQVKAWHERLGHLNFKDILGMKNKLGLHVHNNIQIPVCEICQQGKLTAIPFPKGSERSSETLEIVHSDICGPMRTESNGGARYFVTFIDNNTRWCEVRFLKKRSELLQVFKDYKSLVEKQTGKAIKSLQSDNGREYCSTEFDRFLADEGIKRRLTVAYTPQQNGIAERKNRTLVEMARCMLIQAGLTSSFWAEAIATANHIRNRCCTKSLNGEIPYEKWTQKPIRLHYLRTFGSKVYVLNKSPNKDKFAPRRQEGTLVGYSEQTKGYRVWIHDDHKIVITRDVKILDKFQSQGEHEDIIDEETKNGRYALSKKGKYSNQNTFIGPNIRDELEHAQERSPEEEEIEAQPNTEWKRGRGRPKKIHTGNRGRPKREYSVVRSSTANDEIDSTETGEGNNTDIDEEFIDAETNIAFANVAEVRLQDAMQGPVNEEWKQAIYSEIKSLIDNDTFEIIKRPPNENIIGSRTVLTNKFKSDGSLEKRKARIVAKGYTQKYGVDFNETFAPVARLSSMRLMMALAAHCKLQVDQLDVKTAFLNGILEEEIFMENPEMLREILEEICRRENKKSISVKRARKMLKNLEMEDTVCRLKKALYGLRQAGRPWHRKLDAKLKSLDLIPTKGDPCLYHATRQENIILVLTYVDDILIASQDRTWIAEIKHGLKCEFDVKDLGVAHYCLGIEIQQKEDEIAMTQRKYIHDILEQFGMSDSNPVATPCQVGIKFTRDEDEDDSQESRPYRELVGALMYLAVSTRPDIAHIVSVLSQFNENHTSQHWAAAKRTLRYLRGTINNGLVFRRNENAMIGYVDADWGGCTIDRRSYTGYVFTLSGGAISWESRKQRTVALSSTEAEYMALAEGSKEAIYLQNFLKELEFNDLGKIVMYCDNRGAIQLTKNSVFHNRSKHVDIKYHFVRELIVDDKLKIEYLPTSEMVADVLTKRLPKSKHIKCMSEMGLRST